MNVDLYVDRPGWIHRLDPRTKFGITLASLTAAILIGRPAPMLALVAFLHILTLSTRVPPSRIGQAWRALAPITLFILALSSWTIGEAAAPLARLGPFHLSVAGILQAATMALRISALSFSFLIMLWTTAQSELVAGLTRAGLPHSASLTIAIALQFVPTFGKIFLEILDAQQARGLTIPRRNPIKAARAYLPIVAPLLISALRTIDHLALALAARGYAPHNEKRTSRRQLQWRLADWLCVLGLVALVAGAAATLFVL